MTEKTCTKCGETKPLEAFYRRRSGDEKRRAACKACEAKTAKHRSDHPSLASQIIAHHMEPTTSLSRDAGEMIYTTEPLDPALVAAWKKRVKDSADRHARIKREAYRNRYCCLPDDR